MTVDEIINSALSDGITLSISKVGKLKIEGGEQPIKKWLPAIRENKTAILAALSHQPGRTENTPPPCRDCKRLEIIKIMGEQDPGCLYSITDGEWTEGWKRLPENLGKMHTSSLRRNKKCQH